MKATIIIKGVTDTMDILIDRVPCVGEFMSFSNVGEVNMPRQLTVKRVTQHYFMDDGKVKDVYYAIHLA